MKTLRNAGLAAALALGLTGCAAVKPAKNIPYPFVDTPKPNALVLIAAVDGNNAFYGGHAEKIIRQGELQLTTEQRRTMVEQKKTQIVFMLQDIRKQILI